MDDPIIQKTTFSSKIIDKINPRRQSADIPDKHRSIYKQNQYYQKKVLDELQKIVVTFNQKRVQKTEKINPSSSLGNSRLARSFKLSLQIKRDRKYFEIIRQLSEKLFQQKIKFRETMRAVKQSVREVTTNMQRSQEIRDGKYKQQKLQVQKLVIQLVKKLQQFQKDQIKQLQSYQTQKNNLEQRLQIMIKEMNLVKLQKQQILNALVAARLKTEQKLQEKDRKHAQEINRYQLQLQNLKAFQQTQLSNQNKNQQQSTDLRAKMQQMQQILQQKSSQITILKQNIEKIKQREEQRDKNSFQLQKQLIMLQQSTSQKSVLLGKNVQAIEMLTQKCQNIQELLNKQAQKYEQQKNKVLLLEIQNTQYHKKYQELSKTLKIAEYKQDSKKILQQINKKLQDTKFQLLRVSQQKQQLFSENSRLDSAIKALTQQISKYEQRVQRDSVYQAQTKNRILSMQTIIRQKQLQILTFQKLLSQKKQQEGFLSQQNDEIKTKQIQSNSTRHEEAVANQNQDMKAKIVQLQSIIVGKEQQIKKFQKLVIQKQLLEDLHNTVQSLKSDNINISDQKAELQSISYKYKQQIEVLLAQNKRLNQQIKNLQVEQKYHNAANSSGIFPTFFELLQRSIDADQGKHQQSFDQSQERELNIKGLMPLQQLKQMESYQCYQKFKKQIDIKQKQSVKNISIFNVTTSNQKQQISTLFIHKVPDSPKSSSFFKNAKRKSNSLSYYYKTNQERIRSEFQDPPTFFYYYSIFLQNYFQINFTMLCRQIFIKQKHDKNQFNYLKISVNDLNQYLFEFKDLQQKIKAHAKIIKQNKKQKINICLQYSMVLQFNKTDRQKTFTVPTEQSLIFQKTQEVNDLSLTTTMKQFQRIEDEIKQLKNYFENIQSMKTKSQAIDSIIRQPSKNKKIISDLDQLKDNKVAQMISLLVKQNTIVKKCLNQMMKNQEKLATINNQLYFEEVSISSGQSDVENYRSKSQFSGIQNNQNLNNSFFNQQQKSKPSKSILNYQTKTIKKQQEDQGCEIF